MRSHAVHPARAGCAFRHVDVDSALGRRTLRKVRQARSPLRARRAAVSYLGLDGYRLADSFDSCCETYFFAERFLPWKTKLLKLSVWSILALAAIFPLFWCVAFIRPVSARWSAYFFTLIFFGTLYLNYPDGFTETYYRYAFPFVPIIIAGIACGFSSQFKGQQRITAVCVAISIPFVSLGFKAQFDNYRETLDGYMESLQDCVHWMNANLPSGSVVMLHDAGYAAYAGRFPLVDVAGLKTPYAAEANRELTFPRAGEGRAAAIIMVANKFQPRYLITFKRWNHFYGFADAFGEHGWSVRLLHEGRAAPTTPSHQIYEVFQLAPPRS